MLSQYSDNSVAAVGLANQIIVVTTMIYGFINIGTTIQLTQLSSTESEGKKCKSCFPCLLFKCHFYDHHDDCISQFLMKHS